MPSKLKKGAFFTNGAVLQINVDTPKFSLINLIKTNYRLFYSISSHKNQTKSPFLFNKKKRMKNSRKLCVSFYTCMYNHKYEQ